MMTGSNHSRRSFLMAACGSATALALPLRAWSDGMPPVVKPRTTDGDEIHEPRWDEQFTITVGPDKADLVGTSDRVLQAAVDTMARRGGGTVQLLPGTYTLRSAVHTAVENPTSRQRRGFGASPRSRPRRFHLPTTRTGSIRRSRWRMAKGFASAMACSFGPRIRMTAAASISSALSLPGPGIVSSSTTDCGKMSGSAESQRARPCSRC